LPPLFHIDVRSNLKEITQGLDDFTKKQIPFATATALTTLARMAQQEEKRVIETLFPTATPFTIGSVAVIPARKNVPIATLFMRDIAAAYLEPYVDGGPHHLNSRALLNPKNVALNQYGNIPKGKLASLKGMPDVFVGTIKTKSGQSISGVWQRPYLRPAGAKRGKGRVPKRANTTGKLNLLIRFGDALPVTQHLPWRETAQKVIDANFQPVFRAALARAMATAR
jgi:hypothetical protein